MSKQATIAAALLTGLLSSGAAFANEDLCPSYPSDQWLTKEQLTARAVEMGYDVRNVKVEDGCWEVKGFDQAGQRVELYFDPVTAEIKKVKS